MAPTAAAELPLFSLSQRRSAGCSASSSEWTCVSTYVARKLDGDEGMGLAGIAPGLEVGLGVAVKADRVGLVTRLGAAVADRAVAAQVQAKLDAVAVEAAAPVERRGGCESWFSTLTPSREKEP